MSISDFVTMRGKAFIAEFFSEVVVEPILAGYMTVYIILVFTSTELYREKACRVDLNYTMEICSNMKNHKDIQAEVQMYVSSVQAYNGVLQSLPSIVFTLILGSLSDRYGRKPLILVGLSGLFIQSLVFPH